MHFICKCFPPHLQNCKDTWQAAKKSHLGSLCTVVPGQKLCCLELRKKKAFKYTEVYKIGSLFSSYLELHDLTARVMEISRS